MEKMGKQMAKHKRTKRAGHRYGGRVKGKMKGRVRGDKRRRRRWGLIIECVGGRGEPCRSDRSAELKPSSGLLSCPTDVKASARGEEKGDARRMLTAQGCLWNGQGTTASSTSLPPELISMIITRAKALWSQSPIFLWGDLSQLALL